MGTRITYLSTSIIPSQAANSIQVMKMADAFAAVGVQTQLIGIDGQLGISDTEVRSCYGVKHPFPLLRLPLRPLRQHRLRYLALVLRHLLAGKHDVFYTRSAKLAALAALAGRRAVLELHGPVPPGTLGHVAVKFYLRRTSAARIVVITRALAANIAADFRIDPDRILVAPDGADPLSDDVDLILDPSRDGRLRVGYLGHLYRGKGMEVIGQLAALAPEVDFTIVGGLPEDIAFWSSRFGQLPNVTFHGAVQHADTPGVLRSVDIALLPNQDFVGSAGGGAMNISQWTSPLKLFEYMAAGLPIIASDQQNLREILEDGSNALLCAPDDVHSWLDAINRLAASSGLRAALGQRAREQLEAHYTWQSRARMLATELGWLA